MKKLFIFLFILFSSSAMAEKYSCKYQELNSTKSLDFDRVGHSHFKKCSGEICDQRSYSVIHVDKDNLIFGEIISTEDNNSKGFQVFMIDKKLNLFSSVIITLPGYNQSNKFESGTCIKDK